VRRARCGVQETPVLGWCINKSFGPGASWVPRSYTKMLTNLLKDREAIDYEGALENDEEIAKSYSRRVGNLLKVIRKNTPLLLYPEFIKEILNKHSTVLAVEFDYYCPKAYIHKERIQFQIKKESYSANYIRKLIKAGSASTHLIRASRKDDYVLGWNNRLGQSGDGYLLFLDIDENDEGKVKASLKDRKGWLFKSGGGFHFIGEEILASKEMWLHRFTKAARSKKLKKLIDKKHLDFSVRRGYSTLRITSSDVKNFIPFMCWDNT